MCFSNRYASSFALLTLLPAGISGAAAAQSASQWTRSNGSTVIDVIDLTPKGEGLLIALREGLGKPVYSSGYCTPGGDRLVCSVAATNGRDGHLVLTVRGSALHYRSWNRQGNATWEGNFVRAQGVAETGPAGQNGIGTSASQWTRTNAGTIIDIIDLAPKNEGLTISLREGFGKPVYSSGFCSSAGGRLVCSVAGTNDKQGHLVLAARGNSLHYRSFNRQGDFTWEGDFLRSQGASSPASAPAEAAGVEGIHYRVENLIYNQPDAYQNPRNYHDFMVDWTACRIRNLSRDAEQGKVTLRVLVCRDRTRLTFTSQGPTGAPIEYDFVFRDNGRTVSGAWRQGGGFGPSVGAAVSR